MSHQFKPAETALIVIDMQFDFCSPDGKSARRGRDVEKMRDIIPSLERFAQVISERGGLVIFTRFVAGEGLTPPNLREAVEKEGGDFACIQGSGGEKLFHIQPPADAIILDKPHYDSFAYTPLLDLLQEKQIKNVLVTGVRTEVCVDATAKRAASEGYTTAIVSDLVATYADKYKIHDYFLNFFKNYYGFVLTSEEVLALLAS